MHNYLKCLSFGVFFRVGGCMAFTFIKTTLFTLHLTLWCTYFVRFLSSPIYKIFLRLTSIWENNKKQMQWSAVCTFVIYTGFFIYTFLNLHFKCLFPIFYFCDDSTFIPWGRINTVVIFFSNLLILLRFKTLVAVT